GSKTPAFHAGNRGSNPLRVTICDMRSSRSEVRKNSRGNLEIDIAFRTSHIELRLGVVSSVGRAPALQAGGHKFEPCTAHQKSMELKKVSCFFCLSPLFISSAYNNKSVLKLLNIQTILTFLQILNTIVLQR
ncbi:MAG: hypothetical protein PWQ96_1253, partial [Clostridia bacterium]|nr:hypothetical protein [Clostridia bacterium]